MPKKSFKFFKIKINDKYFIPLAALIAFLEPSCIGEILLALYLLPKAFLLRKKRVRRR